MAGKNHQRKEKKLKRLLILIWIVFAVMLAGFGYFALRERDKISADLGTGEETSFSYRTNANKDINALMTIYLTALADADQETLKSCVTDPGQFDNMTAVQVRSQIITGYNNINCFTVDGLDADSTVVYTTANVKLPGIETQPPDIFKSFYVVKKGNAYLIDNSVHSAEVQEYLDKVDQDPDIRNLCENVKEDEEKAAAQDPALRRFLSNLNQPASSGDAGQ